MHQTTRKILACFLAVGTLCVSLPDMQTEAAAEMWLDGEEDGFYYSIQLNYNYAVITGCDPSKTGVVKVPDTVGAAPVKVIGGGAFSGCGHTDEELEEMGAEHSASGCGITELILPDSVTTIEHAAFRDCEDLKAIHFPAGLESFNGKDSKIYSNDLESGCFGYASWTEGCTKLEKLTISKSNPYFKSVGGIIYSKDGSAIGPVPYGISFDSVNLSGVTKIGDYAFCGHSEITELNLPSHITAVGDHAFQDCKNLQTAYVPEAVRTIGDYAFAGCSLNMSDENMPEYYSISILLSEGLESVGDYAFSRMYGLTYLNLPQSLTTLGKGTFAGDNRLLSMRIPAKVTVIPDNLFERCYELQGVSLPEGLQEIGAYAFYGPMKLKTVHLPEGLKSIGNYAFACFGAPDPWSKTTGLLYMTIPDSVEYIGANAFATNSNLTGVKLPENPAGTVMGERAFEGCSSMERVHIPGSIHQIPSYAFSGSRWITIDEGVTEIGDNAFRGLLNLEILTLPESLKTIGACAFAEIGSHAFFWNGSEYVECGIRSLTVPDGVTDIGYGAFAGSNLRDILLSDSLRAVGFRAFDNTNLAVQEYPEGITELNEWYTMGCENLNAIYLPDTLESIEPLAIAKNADLAQIVFHDDRFTTDLSDWSVSNLEMVPDVYFAGTEQEWKALTKNWDFSEYDTDPSVMDKVTVHFNAKRQSSLLGDVNADGQFTVADMVLLQKWLIGKGILHSPDNGDMNGDGILNSWDLVRMRRALLEGQEQEALG